MSVTIPEALPAIAFSKNMLNLGVVSDNYRAASPVKSVNFLNFTGAIAADDAVILGWTGAGASMVAKDVPDGSGNQFLTGDGLAPYVESLVPYFQSNFFIDAAYVVTFDSTGGPHLVFTARKPGADYDFIDTDGGLAGNTTPGKTDQPVANFAHHIEGWIANAAGTDYDQAFSANVPLDEPLTGATTIDIHDELHAFLSSDYPELVNPYAICKNSIRQYFIKYAQYFGDVPAVQKIFRTDAAVITKGGLSKQQALLRDITGELHPVSGHPENNRFLRQGSVNKHVRKDQPEWLTWINLSPDTAVVNLSVVIYFDDDSTGTFNAVEALSVNAFQKVQFQVGFEFLEIIDFDPSKNPTYYTVQLTAEGGVLTQVYAFVLDNTFREFPRYFVYENSYGAFQTLAAVGRGLVEYDRSKNDALMSVDLHTAAIAGEFIESDVFVRDKGTVNIGYDRASKRNTMLLRDFFISHTIYSYENMKLYPIGLNTKNAKDAADGVNVYASTFEYFYKYQEEVWTEPTGGQDENIAGLLTGAGSPVPVMLPGNTSQATIIVEFGDAHLSIAGGEQSYTAHALIGKTNYRVWSTQLGRYLLSSEIGYDSGTGSLTILIDSFALVSGEQLIIFPYVLNPDS